MLDDETAHGRDTAQALHDSLQAKAAALREELTRFQAYIAASASAGAELGVSVSRFCREVEHEAEAIRKVSLSNDRWHGNGCDGGTVGASSAASVHRLRSSNLSFYEAIWNVAKQSTGLVGLQRRMKWAQQSAAGSASARRHAATTTNEIRESSARTRRKTKETIIVDVVADDGQKWIKVWTKTQHWLLLDLAKEGLVLADSTSDEEQDSPSFDRQIDDGEDLKIVRLAQDLQDAAKQTRIKHKHPTVHLVLLNIEEGVNEEVDTVLRKVRSSGTVVECGFGFAGNEKGEQKNSSSLENVFAKMIGESQASEKLLSTTVNVDCTLLVALVSNISHILPHDLVIPNHYEGSTYCTIKHQVESESAGPLLPSDVYPVLAGREIVCTKVVAAHFRKIIASMATDEELMRSRILLGDGEYAGVSTSELRRDFQSYSSHAVPNSLQLPVKAVDFDHTFDISASSVQSHISSLEAKIAQVLVQEPKLTYLNASAFLHGWTKDLTTLTLNRVVSSWIQRTIDKILDDFETAGRMTAAEQTMFRGPVTWTCSRDRSLLGTEKNSVRS